MAEIPVDAIPSENKPVDPALAQLPYDLPKLPATFQMLGRCGSGKSSILWALLTKGYVKGKKKNKSIFHEIVVYLGSQDSISAFKSLPCKNLIVLQEFVPEDFDNYLEDLKKHQMERLEQGKHPLNCAVIFDDFVGRALLKHSNGKASPLERIALTSRHEANLSLFFCSQVYKGTGFSSPSMRNNTTTYVISNMSSPEMIKIAEEQSQNFTPDQFIQIYNKAMETPYNFLTIDYRRPLDDRIREKFTGKLNIKPKVEHGKEESDSEGAGSDAE